MTTKTGGEEKHTVTKEEAGQLNKELHQILEKDERPRIENATLENVYKVTEKYLHVNDRNRIDIILATALTNQLEGTPIWMFIVGNSGDWKSAFARSLEGVRNVIKVDQITKNTLASGLKNADDLGGELNQSNKILLFPDLAALTSMNTDEKNSIWGQFRNLYDGFIEKRTGSGIHRKYDGCHVTLIACTTQAIRDEILIHAQLGTRELMYDTKTDTVDNDFKMDKAWENEKFEEKMRKDIQNIVCDFLTYNKIKNIAITKEIKDFLKKEANRLSILRATGMVDRVHKELLNPIYPEVPTRLIKQFKRIYKALKSLDDNYPDEKAKQIIFHIVDSSGNKVRQIVLKVLKDKEIWLKISEIQQETKLGRKSVKGQLEMLWNLNVIEKEVREERIGGYVSDFDGHEIRKGGRIEEIAYYRYRRKVVSPHYPSENEENNIYRGETRGNHS